MEIRTPNDIARYLASTDGTLIFIAYPDGIRIDITHDVDQYLERAAAPTGSAVVHAPGNPMHLAWLNESLKDVRKDGYATMLDSNGVMLVNEFSLFDFAATTENFNEIFEQRDAWVAEFTKTLSTWTMTTPGVQESIDWVNRLANPQDDPIRSLMESMAYADPEPTAPTPRRRFRRRK